MKAYWDSLTKEQQGELAGKVGSTPGYLRLVFNGYKKASFVLAKKLEQCTSGAITKSDLRPDMGDQQRQRYQVQLSLRQKYQQQLEQLRRDSEQKGTYNTDDYRKAEQALTESLNRQLNENRRYWQQLEVVQGNWKNGVLRAFQDFTVDADNTAGTAEQVFSSAFSNMGNGLATFVTTGKLNFKSFTSSVLSDMAKILAQATMMKSIKGIGSVPDHVWQRIAHERCESCW